MKKEHLDVKKKILFIIMSYTKGGGAESLLTTIVNNLSREKYEISILEIIHDDVKIEPTHPDIHILPYIMRADDPERKRKMYYVYHEPEKVFQKFVKNEYDLYVSFNYQRPIFLLPPGKRNIAWIHGDIYNLAAEDKKEELRLEDNALDKVQHIVAISDITAKSIRDLHPRHSSKLIEINNGIDIDQILQKAKHPTHIFLEHPSILAVGRLDKNKNPVRVIDILSIVHQKYHLPLHAYFLGYGDQTDATKAHAEELRMEGYVHFLGYHENPFPIIKQCDISTLMSKSEGFGMCFLESLVLGKPIVAPDVGAVRLLTHDQNCGAVIETNQEAAAVINRLLHTDSREIQASCKKSARRFSLDKYIAQIEKLFDETLKE